MTQMVLLGFNYLEDVTEIYVLYWNEWLGIDNTDAAT